MVEQIDYGDIADLRARLEAIEKDDDRRLVMLFGSGLSNSVIPDIKGVTSLFRSYLLPASSADFDAMIAPIDGSALAYQNAASFLKRRRGDAVLARAIRQAVLAACDDVSVEDRAAASADIEYCKQLERTGKWSIPAGYANFAKYFSSISGSLRGQILTTNFDPLIEISLRQAGLETAAIPVHGDASFTVEQLTEQASQPVIHLHGFWTSTSTLNTITQLTGSRPYLHGMLRRLLTKSITLVLGYGGWQDAFMTALTERVSEADLLGAEILWAAYDPDPGKVASNPTLYSLSTMPGFTLYLGIDGNKVFDSPSIKSKSVKVSPFGYTLMSTINIPDGPVNTDFIAGRNPSWADAVPGAWPRLEATDALCAKANDILAHGGGSGVIALGPMGEGKSLALRQSALSIAAASDWTVLWREPGAPNLSRKWLTDVRESYGPVLICADDADLISSDLATTRDVWAKENSEIALLLASQDRLWRQRSKTIQANLSEVIFHGLNESEANSIVAAWAKIGALPSNERGDEASIDRISAKLSKSSQSMFNGRETTLFGAILDVRYGEALASRVKDLVAKLQSVKITSPASVTLADIFKAICVMQYTFDEDGNVQRGATRSVIAALAGLDSVFADGKILELLGREAAVAYAGGRVYSRHPAIAKAVVTQIRQDRSILDTVRRLGKAGARLRQLGGPPISEYADAYLLGRNLSDPYEAVAAAEGALQGAPHLLEPRVTYLSVLRKNTPQRSESYGYELAKHADDFDDIRTAIRALLVELSQLAARDGKMQVALGLAALSLADGIGYSLDEDRARYGLVQIIKCSQQLRVQKFASIGSLPEAARVALIRLIGENEATRFVGRMRMSADTLNRIRVNSGMSLASMIIQACSGVSLAVIEQYQLPLKHVTAFRLQDFQRLLERANGQHLPNR
ncbi:MAG TPA: SIR2 family protein [Pseudonocardiaceae bacterium]|jgi:hypothetical protein|nr:SIR2 family protein [Pseudonocardiaceae bacterium]